MWEEILPIIYSIGATVLSLLGTIGIYYLRKWSKKLMDKFESSEAEREAVEALMAGVEHAHEGFVKEAKRLTEDGKLSKEDREKALEIAITKAKTLAKGPGLDLLKASSKERLGAWVKQILAKWKD